MERSLLLFYLLPISLAAWFGSLLTALGIAVISIAVSLLSDVAAGSPALGFWNAGMALQSDLIVCGEAEDSARKGKIRCQLPRRTASRSHPLGRCYQCKVTLHSDVRRRRMPVGLSTTKIFGQVYLSLPLCCARLQRDIKASSGLRERQGPARRPRRLSRSRTATKNLRTHQVSTSRIGYDR